MDPVESLARVLGVPTSAVERLAILEGGYANHSYRLRCGEEEYVLRLPASSEELPGADREAERLALLAVQPHGLSPELVFSDPGSGLLVTRYLSGRRWTHADFGNEDALRRLGQRLVELHAIEPPTSLRRLDLGRHITELEKRAQRLPDALRQGARAMLDRFAPRATTLCHNDIHAGNVIEHDGIRLLDWEYAAVGDPMFDLAGPICCERIDARAQAYLIGGYREGGGRADLMRLAAAVWLYDYVMCLWELATVPASDSIEPPVAAMRQPVSSRIAELEGVLHSLDKPMIERHF